MNAVVPGPDTRESAYLTIGAGRRVSSTANYRPSRSVPAGGPGLLGEVCRNSGKRVAYLGARDGSGQFSGAGYLAAMDDDGRVPYAASPEASASAPGSWAGPVRTWLTRVDLIVIDLPPGSLPEFALAVAVSVIPLLDPERDMLILASPDPGPAEGGQWMGLSPVLLRDPRGASGRLLTSATTRTDGLLANVDIAPTILAHMGAAVPAQMEGHAARSGGRGGLEQLSRFAARARATRAAMVPGLIGWGAVLLSAVAWATAALLRPASSAQLRAIRIALMLAVSGPVAMLMAAAVPASSPPALLATIALIACVLCGIAAAASRTAPERGGVLLVLAFTGIVILVDLLAGGTMLARNLMSDMPNLGARFYGIGNEYMGLAMGIAILLPFWLDCRPGCRNLSALGWSALAVGWPLTLFAVGSPGHGADFGGALALAIGFLAAGVRLRALATGKPVRPAYILAGACVVAAVGAGLVILDLARPPEARSHLGELAARFLSDGLAPVAQVAGRKALLNVQMAVSPYFVGGILAAAPLAWLWYHRLGRFAMAALDERPLMKAGLSSTLAGGLAALVLNDTGVVALVLAVGCALFLWLDLLLAESLRAMANGDGTREGT